MNEHIPVRIPGDTATIPNVAEIKKFLSLLWPSADEGLLTIVSIKEGKISPKFFLIGHLQDGMFESVARLAIDQDVYHTVGLLKARPEKGRGAEPDVIGLPGLWLDLDCREGKHNVKDLPSRDEALSFLKEFPLHPSLIVWSGGGLHVYWLFKEPLYFHNEDERQAVKSVSSKFQKTMIQRASWRGWKLDNTSDLCRLLRIPGSINFKREPVMVEILSWTDQRYEVGDFDQYLIDEQAKGERPPEAKSEKAFDGDLASLPVSIAVRKLIKEGQPPGERSEAIMSVLTTLMSAGVDEVGICRIFASHPQGIGQKYLEKGPGKEKWLKGEIQRAREKFHPNKSSGHSQYSEESAESEIRELESRTWSRWPVLAPEALSGFAGRFVELATKSSEADPAAVLITFLSRFAVECGSRPYFFIGDARHSARIFTVIVGSSSKSRKGTSGKPVERLFKMDHITEADQYDPARISPGPLSTGEGLIYTVRDEVTAWKTDKDSGQGAEVVVDPGVKDKRLFVLDEEFSSALISSRRDGNTLSTILRCIWDSGNLEPLTKSSRIKATGAHIGIVSHITLAELSRRLEEVETFSGFANRILWVCARRQGVVPLPDPMPVKDLASLQYGMKGIIERARGCGQMVFDDDATNMWMDVYGDLSKDGSGLVGCVTDRAEAQVIRLSMIYSLLDLSGTIRPDHLRSALAMWRYCEESARFIFSGREINPFSNKIVDLLRDSGAMSTTEIYAAFSRNISKRQLEEALTELISQRKVAVETIKGEGQRGRPKTVFKCFLPLGINEQNERNEESTDILPVTSN